MTIEPVKPVKIGPHVFDHAHYDERGDVLYLAIGEPQEAAHSVMTPEGHVVRYNDADEIIGVTLINAKWLIERDGGVHVSLPVQVDDLEPALD